MSCCDESPTSLSGDRRVLLAGQPNSGKTSVFNALTGARQRVGNWPGVTVERKEGRCAVGESELVIVDLPGSYSLEPYSLEERVTRDALAAEPDAVVINVVDATRLERQLPLTLQMIAAGNPLVVALTMNDELAAEGRSIDAESLGRELGAAVVKVDGRRGAGARELAKAAFLATKPQPSTATGMAAAGSFEERHRHSRALSHTVMPAPSTAGAPRGGLAGRADALALHPVAGPLLFLAVIFAMFQLTFSLGGLLGSLLDSLMASLDAAAATLTIPLLASFVRGALLGGVGNVVSLVPFVFIMFLILSFLEDSGYMARAAFATDAFMHRVGLHGKAFIPLVMGFGCNVPAIMAARTLESPRDRLRVMLMVPFTSCSARLPVYVLIAGAFFGRRAGFVVFGLYVAGILAGIGTAMVSAKVMSVGRGVGLIMELPPYRLPLPKSLLLTAWQRTKEYLAKAGSIILLASAFLWLLSAMPLGSSAADSLLGKIGHFISPVFAPLGFDWRMVIGLASGFVAKEVVISTLGVLAPAGSSLSAALPGMMGPGAALAYLVFILLYTPCLATIAVMRSESGSRKWTTISVAWGITLAYCSAFVVRLAAALLGLA